MAKVIEEVKAYRTEIKLGDVVVYNRDTFPNTISIVVAIRNGSKPTKSYDLINLQSGAMSTEVEAARVELYHGTIKLTNEL